MCLLKVYLEEGGVRRLVAVDVALIRFEHRGLRLKFVEKSEELILENVEPIALDALNSVIVLKPRHG